MNADDPLERAIGEWQRKHHIADGDPMIAVLELVRIYLHHARREDSQDIAIPSFDDFRGTIELLDLRSKSFINQAADLVGELRRFGQNVERLNRVRFVTVFVVVALATTIGVLIGRSL
ncbi:MAG TPA: hypothetical protein VGQ65_06775 [Thermoanaerobaculia bacterium]|nr:hypothetical protein [Thermoanaerobaculia bacterium]